MESESTRIRPRSRFLHLAIFTTWVLVLLGVVSQLIRSKNVHESYNEADDDDVIKQTSSDYLLSLRMERGKQQLYELVENLGNPPPPPPKIFVELGRRAKNGRLVEIHVEGLTSADNAPGFLPSPENPLYCDHILYSEAGPNANIKRSYGIFHKAYAVAWKDEGVCYFGSVNSYRRPRRGRPFDPKSCFWGRYYTAMIVMNWVASGALRKIAAFDHFVDVRLRDFQPTRWDMLDYGDYHEAYNQFLLKHAQIHFGIPDTYHRLIPTVQFHDDDSWLTNKFISPSEFDKRIWNAATKSETVWNLVRKEPKFQIPLLNFTALGQSDVRLHRCLLKTSRLKERDIQKLCSMNDYALNYVLTARRISTTDEKNAFEEDFSEAAIENNSQKILPIISISMDAGTCTFWGLNAGSQWFFPTETTASVYMGMYTPEFLANIGKYGDQGVLNRLLMEFFSFRYAEPDGIYTMALGKSKILKWCGQGPRSVSKLARDPVMPGLNSTMWRGGSSGKLAIFKHGLSFRPPGAYPGDGSDQKLREPSFNASVLWDEIRNKRMQALENLTQPDDGGEIINIDTGLRQVSFGGLVPTAMATPSSWQSGLHSVYKEYAWRAGDYSLHQAATAYGPSCRDRLKLAEYTARPPEIDMNLLLGEPLMTRDEIKRRIRWRKKC